MNEKQYTQVILEQSTDPTGFLELARSGVVDDLKLQMLRQAVDAWASEVTRRRPPMVSRTVVASLFEVPWELENAARRLARRDPAVASRLDGIADDLRVLIHDALWEGILP